jgi:siroheme synthase
MGLARLGEIASGLVEHGLDPETPAAVISAGTTAEQEAVTATIATVADAAKSVRPPALIVVGDVVSLSERLAAVRGTLALA